MAMMVDGKPVCEACFNDDEDESSEPCDADGDSELNPEARLCEALTKALDGWEECAQYKSKFLVQKHGDLEMIAELREVAKRKGRAG